MSKRRPSIFIRAVVRLFRELGYEYVLMPFSAPRECNMCGYKGKFRHSGLYNVRPDALCMSCWSTDRERLFALYLQRGLWDATDKDILHFAHEPRIGDIVKPRASRYVTADLYVAGADVAWNVEEIDCEDQAFDGVICSHVLEHVDTQRALGEIFRVLRPGGTAFLMIPIYEGLDETYSDASIPQDQQHLHFHQHDHSRLIGRDFRTQITDAGFTLSEYNAAHDDIVRYGMIVGEKVFVCTRP